MNAFGVGRHPSQPPQGKPALQARRVAVAQYPTAVTDAVVAKALGTTAGLVYAIRWAIAHPLKEQAQ